MYRTEIMMWVRWLTSCVSQVPFSVKKYELCGQRKTLYLETKKQVFKLLPDSLFSSSEEKFQKEKTKILWETADCCNSELKPRQCQSLWNKPGANTLRKLKA